MKKTLLYMVSQQKKISTFIIASALLLGGLAVPGDPAKYSAFSIAIAGMASVLFGAHAVQKKNEQAQNTDIGEDKK